MFFIWRVRTSPYRKPETVTSPSESVDSPMGDLYQLIWCAIAGLFGLRAASQAEILILRHQLNVSPFAFPGRRLIRGRARCGRQLHGVAAGARSPEIKWERSAVW